MFKNNRALALALLFVSAPLACGFGTASAARLKSSLRARNASRFAPVQGYLNAEDTQVLAKPATADVPAALVCLPPLLLPPEPADAAVLPIPPPPPPSNPLHWPPYADQFELFDLAWRPRNMEPLKSHLVCKTVDAEVDRFWTHAAPPLSLVCNVLLNMVEDITLPVRLVFFALQLAFSVFFVASYLSHRFVRFASFRVLWMAYYTHCILRVGSVVLYVSSILSWNAAVFLALILCQVSLMALDVLLCAVLRLGATALLGMYRFVSTRSTAPTLSSAPSGVQVFVKTQTMDKSHQSVTVDDVMLSGTVRAFKEQLAAKTGASCLEVCLVFEGKTLVDDQPLTKYGIRKESTVHGVFRGRGGMPSPGAGPSSETREEERARLMTERNAKKQRTHSHNAGSSKSALLTEAGRAASRIAIRASCDQSLEFRMPPTLQSVQAVMQRLRDILLVREELRDPDTGEVKRSMLMRACPISALARNPHDGEPDLDQASMFVLPMLQALYDYTMAKTGDEATVLAGRYANPGDMNVVQAPEHRPNEKDADKSGYMPFKDTIHEAYEERVDFHEWAAQKITDASGELVTRYPHAARMLPCGDIVAPFLLIWGRARESKSQLIIGLVGLLLRVPGVRICISVAPNKDTVLQELIEKVNQAGWEEYGMATVRTTAAFKEGSSAKIDDATIDKWAEEATVFLYSHDVANDVKAYDKLVKKWAAQPGIAVISIHDEADTLVKQMREHDEDNPEKDNILQILRDSYSLKYTRTVMVGATLAATLNEDSLWGTLLKGREASQWVKIQVPDMLNLIPPIEPSREFVEYIGINDVGDKAYDIQRNSEDRNPYTMVNIRNTLFDLRPRHIAARKQRAAMQLQKAQDQVVDGKVVLHRRRRKANQTEGDWETQEAADYRHQAAMERATQAVDAAQELSIDDPYPDILRSDGTVGHLPMGLCTLYIDELATAMIMQRTRAFLATDPKLRTNPSLGETEDHWVNQTLVVAPTNKQQYTSLDPGGGCLGYALAAVELAIEIQQPLALLLYTSASAAKITNLTNFACGPTGPKGQWGPVKLFLVLPHKEMVTLDDDNVPLSQRTPGDHSPTEVLAEVWKPIAVAGYASALAAIGAARQAMAHTDHDILYKFDQLRVIYTGYEMFKAAVTLSVSNYEMPKINPNNPNEKVRRVHFMPKSMIYCHQPNRQFAMLYQTIARTFNSILSFTIPTINGTRFMIDILTHKDTRLYVANYYKIEEKLVSLWRGDISATSRQPQELLNGLASFTHDLADKMGERSPEKKALFLKRALGLRNLSLADTVSKGDANLGGIYTDPSEFYDLEDGDQMSEDTTLSVVSDDEDDSSSDNTNTFADIMGFVACLGLLPGYKGEAWVRKGLIGTPYTINITQLNQREQAIMNLSTREEVHALQRKMIPAHGIRKPVQPSWLSSKCLDSYKDLNARVLPVFWKVVWKLVDARDLQPVRNIDNIRIAKREAHQVHLALKAAFRYLIVTKQFLPRGQDMWEQVRTFARELGDHASTPDHSQRCFMRGEMLKHMFRGLVVHKVTDTSDHINYVTVMSLLLDRIDMNLPVEAAPWNLAPYNAENKYANLEMPTKDSATTDDSFHNDIEDDAGHFDSINFMLPDDDQGEEKQSILKLANAGQPSAGPRKTFFSNMTPAMLKEVKDKWPTEINEDMITKYKNALKDGIPHPDDIPHPDGRVRLWLYKPTKDNLAQKQVNSLYRGLYHIMHISKNAGVQHDPAYQFKIHSNDSALVVMQRHFEEMLNEGALSQFCYKNPSIDKPYAWQGNDNNPSAVIDWRGAFMRWIKIHG